MVKKSGKKSAVFIIEKMLDLAWYLGIIFGALLIAWQLFLVIAEPEWLSENMKLQFETRGLLLRFNEGFIAPDAGRMFILQFTLIAPLLAIGLLIIYQLRKLFYTIRSGDPFSRENSRRIQIIGIAVIASSVLSALLSFLIGSYLATLIDLPGLDLMAHIRLQDFGGVFVGIIILILAEVFQHGARLQEESNLTV